MEVLGIGLPEMLFIILIALIVLGPRDMEKAGRTIGIWLRKLVTSDEWQALRETSRQISTLPNKWMREASEDLYKVDKEVKTSLDPKRTLGSWAGADVIIKAPEELPTVRGRHENIIAPLDSGDAQPESDDA